jgi:hypothetical protein
MMEMIDASIVACHCRTDDRSAIVISSGPDGHSARTTGVQTRRTAILQTAIGRRQRGPAMFATQSPEAEQELPKSISEPRKLDGGRLVTNWGPRVVLSKGPDQPASLLQIKALPVLRRNIFAAFAEWRISAVAVPAFARGPEQPLVPGLAVYAALSKCRLRSSVETRPNRRGP